MIAYRLIEDRLDQRSFLEKQSLQSERSKVSRFVGRLWRSTAAWLEYDGGVYSAAMAYYAAIALFPTLLLFNSFFHLSGGSDSVLGSWQRPFFETLEAEYSLEFRTSLESAMNAAKNTHVRFGCFGVGWLALTILLVFAQLDRGFSRLWNPKKVTSNNLANRIMQLIQSRTRAFMLLVGFVFLFFGLFIFSIMLDGLGRFLVDSEDLGAWFRWEIHLMVHVALHVVFFGVLFKWLTPMPVKWPEAFQSSLLLSISWEIGRQFAAALTFQKHQSLYSVGGGFMLILFWIYYASVVVFWSAAYLKILVEDREKSTLLK